VDDDRSRIASGGVAGGSDRWLLPNAEPHSHLWTIGRHCGQWHARDVAGTAKEGGYRVCDWESAMVDRMGGATLSPHFCDPGGTMKIAPPPLSGPGGTMKMISLAINLCFCTGRPPSLKPMAHISPSLHTPSFPLLQERIGTGSSNLVARLVTRAAMHCN